MTTIPDTALFPSPTSGDVPASPILGSIIKSALRYGKQEKWVSTCTYMYHCIYMYMRLLTFIGIQQKMHVVKKYKYIESGMLNTAGETLDEIKRKTDVS